jgi:AcrR family transcriptional regulator
MDKPYHHGDLRNALLEALDVLLRDSGPEAASTRALARDIGVAPSAVFRHFRDRRALLTAYAAVGFARLADRVEAAAPGLRDIAAAYLDFAFAEPGRFRTMFRADLLDIMDADLREGQVALNRALGIGRKSDIGARESDVPLVLHAAMQGFATLAMETPMGERLPDDPIERRAAILTMLRRLTTL